MRNCPIGQGRGYALGSGLDALGASVEMSVGPAKVKADGVSTGTAVAVFVGAGAALLYFVSR